MTTRQLTRELPPCAVCGTPTSSRYGVCSNNTVCKNAARQVKRKAASKTTYSNCLICGNRTSSMNSLCYQTIACVAASRVAYRINAPVRYMLRAARARAYEQNVPFSLLETDIHIPEHCPVLKIRLAPGSGAGATSASPSLDRVIPELGYVPGNICIISTKANSMKRDATAEELKTFCTYYLDSHNEPVPSPRYLPGKPSNPDQVKVSCTVCGDATRSSYGICKKTRACRTVLSLTQKTSNPARYILKTARTRAHKHGTPFSIDEQDILIPARCPVLGMELKFGGNLTGNPCSPSLDRIDPRLGYVTGNVQVISLQANRMKRDATPEELRRFCEYYLGVQEAA